jgi:hypothetical protein
MAGTHVLWVNHLGEVLITLLIKETPVHWAKRMSEQVKFRYEAYGAGNGYVGINAANDDKYISDLFNRLLNDWQNDRRGYIDI